MATHKVRLTIQDMTWDKCVSRVENTLKSIPGVLDVRAKLTDKNVGQAEIFYNAAEVSPDDFKQAVPRASGEKHNFKVISVIEGG